MKPISVYSIGLLWFMLFLIPMAWSQNMVPNPGFTDNAWCPLGRGMIGWATPWFSPNYNTTDYAHACAGEDSYSGVPGNRWGWQEPALGEGYAGIRTYISTEFFVSGKDYREYLAVELLDTMIAGQTYLMSLKYSVGDSAAFFSDDLGMFVTADTIPNENTLYYEPVVANPEGNILRNTETWEELSGSYTAKGGERFLIIGNFKNDENTTLERRPDDPSYYLTTYFYIDDVKVEPCGPLFPENLFTATDSALCPGESLDVFVTEIDSAIYTWEDGNDKLFRTLTQAKTYTLQVQVDQCIRTDTLDIQAVAGPIINFGEDTTLCPGESLTLSFSGEADSYSWSNQSDDSIITVTAAGTYTLQASLGNCWAQDEIHVSYAEAPEPVPLFDTLICIGSNILLSAHHQDFTYSWQDLSSSRQFLASEGGLYAVDMQNTCFQTRQEFRIRTEDCGCESLIPNVFSPNQDGIHDSFVPLLSAGSKDFRIEVFDRWGNQVFVSKDMSKPWDGAGEKEGVYYYVISYACEENGSLLQKQKKGAISLLR